MSTPESATRMTLRIPDDLLKRIRAAAERDRRSAHNELLWLAERELDRQEEEKADG